MKFYVHSTFPPHFLVLLRAYDGDSEFASPDDLFPDGASDRAWISYVAAEEPTPVILCVGTRASLGNHVKRKALAEAGCSFICLAEGWADVGWEDAAWRLLKAWPAAIAMAASLKRPGIVEVTKNGKPCKVKL